MPCSFPISFCYDRQEPNENAFTIARLSRLAYTHPMTPIRRHSTGKGISDRIRPNLNRRVIYRLALSNL